MFKIFAVFCAIVGGTPECLIGPVNSEAISTKVNRFSSLALCQTEVSRLKDTVGEKLKKDTLEKLGPESNPMVEFECREQPKGEEEI